MKYINKESVEFVKNYGDVLAGKYYHGFTYPDGVNAIGDCGQKVSTEKNGIYFIFTTKPKMRIMEYPC